MPCRYLIGSATVAVGWSAYVVHALQEAGCPIDRRFIEAPIVYNSDLGVRRHRVTHNHQCCHQGGTCAWNRKAVMLCV